MTSPIESNIQVGRTCNLCVDHRVFEVEILGVSREMLWVSYPSGSELAEGTGVELEFRDGEGFVGYHARVGVLPSVPGNGLVLCRSESATHLAQRVDWRVPTDFPVTVRRIGGEQQCTGRMLDLTQKGSLVATTGDFNVGEAVELFFELPGFAANSLLARIVYSDKSDTDGECSFGLRFVELTPNCSETIMWYLYDRIWDLYAKELRELYPPSVSKRERKATRRAKRARLQSA